MTGPFITFLTSLFVFGSASLAEFQYDLQGCYPRKSLAPIIELNMQLSHNRTCIHIDIQKSMDLTGNDTVLEFYSYQRATNPLEPREFFKFCHDHKAPGNLGEFIKDLDEVGLLPIKGTYFSIENKEMVMSELAINIDMGFHTQGIKKLGPFYYIKAPVLRCSKYDINHQQKLKTEWTTSQWTDEAREKYLKAMELVDNLIEVLRKHSTQ